MLVLTRRDRTLLACSLIALVVAAFFLRPGQPAGPGPGVPATALRPQYLQVPLGFEANRGQTHSDVQFLSRGLGYSLFLTATEAVFSLSPKQVQAQGSDTSDRLSSPVVVRMSLVGANANPVMEGQAKQAGVSHYLTGKDASHWQRNVERFGKVRYGQVYPGIDLIYYGNQQQLEYDFVVAPGADPRRIRLDFKGVDALRLDKAGNLVLPTATGDLIQHRPIAYQEIAGRRHPVESRYRLLANNQVEFDVADYDSAHPLTIDPVLVYKAQFGGQATEAGLSIAVDLAGNTYITGYTNSANFPVHPQAPQQQHGGGRTNTGWPLRPFFDAFVTKISAAGDTLVYSTYLGGNDEDFGHGIAVDAAGHALVTGSTRSTNFPLFSAWQTTKAGETDAFVAKLTPDGSALVYSSFLGGAVSESGAEIAVDGSGNAYVTGNTRSVDFPTTAGVLQPALEGESNAFVTKLSPQGAIEYSTYVVGAGNGIAVDDAGNAYIGGGSYIAKIASAGDALIYRTYVGDGSIVDIAVDGTGSAYVTGSTSSRSFPLVNPFQSRVTGQFVSKLDPTGSALVYSSYFGAEGDVENGALVQSVESIAVDNEGSAYVTGWNNRAPGLITDAFITRISPSGNTVLFHTYVGGATGQSSQLGFGIAIDGPGNVYVTGRRSSTDDVFVSKLVSPQWKVAGVGDTNADGNDDLLWHSPDLQQLDWWGMAEGTRQAIGSHFIPSQYRIATTADFNGDGRSDLLWQDNAKTTLWIWQAEAGGGFSIQFVDNYPPAGWEVVGAGDVDGDGRADILWHNPELEQLDWWRMDGSTRLAVNSQYIPSQYRVAATVDFNGDGRTDILWHDDAKTTLWVWQAAANGFSIHFVDNFPPPGWEIVGAGDVNADGQADVLWQSIEWQQLDWWLMAGAQRIGIGSKFISPRYRVDAIGDFNNDRRQDILWRDEERTQLWIWQAESDGFSLHFLDRHPVSI